MSPKELSRDEEERLYDVKSYILNHLDEPLTVLQLARKAALGEQRFTESFARLIEMHVGAFIHSTKMKTGNFLIRNTDKSIKEIAALCGYSKTRNFSSAYRKFFGKSPSGERKERIGGMSKSVVRDYG